MEDLEMEGFEMERLVYGIKTVGELKKLIEDHEISDDCPLTVVDEHALKHNDHEEDDEIVVSGAHLTFEKDKERFGLVLPRRW
jgi:hypothetical protein